MKKILLMGNPNVGKSAIFSRLTGVRTIISNYSGTTIEFTEGYINYKGKRDKVIDVPGAYTLEPTNEAEKVAVEMLNKGCDIVVCVMDATNLERGLNLTLQLLKRRIPTIIVLNIWDEAKHKGIKIDIEKMEKYLNVPVVSTCGITGEGIKKFVDRLSEANISQIEYEEKAKWTKIGEIIENVQVVTHRHHTFLETLGDLSIHHIIGIPIAIIILYISFTLIRLIGEGLIGYVTEPLFEKYWMIVLERISYFLHPGSFLHSIFIGQLIEGGIDFGQSFGILSTGLFIPIAAVLPYIFAFYLVLSLLEDCGYLPRLGVMVDNIFHKLGLHGLSIVPMLLGLGCNVPGALGTRILESKRERFIAGTLMAIAVPCMAQIAMIAGLIGPYGAKGFGLVFGTLFIVLIITGVVMNMTLKGESPEIFIEIPPYRIPYWKAILKKLWMRLYGFLKEALPYVMLGVFIVNILYTIGAIELAGRIFSPIVTKVFGLPKEAIGALIVGFLRKDVAVGMLAPLGLSFKQLVISCVVLAMYFPCIATFTVLAKELGFVDMLKSVLIMIISTLIVGGLLNLIL